MSSSPSSTKRHHHRGRTREQEWKQPTEITDIIHNNNNFDLNSNAQDNLTLSASAKRRRHHHRARNLEHDRYSDQHFEDGSNEKPEQQAPSSTSSHRKHRRRRHTHIRPHSQPPTNQLASRSRRSHSTKARSETSSNESSSSKEEKQEQPFKKRELVHDIAAGRKLYESGRGVNEREKKGWKYHTSIAASSDLPDKQLKANVTMEKNVKLKGIEYMAFRLLKLQDQNVRRHEIPGIGAIGVQVLDGHRHAITGLKVAKKKGREAKVVVSVDLHLPVKL